MLRLIIGIFLICCSAMGSDVMKEGHSPGKWTQDLDAALKYAKASKKQVLLNFTGSDWCGWCKLMDKNVFAERSWQMYASRNLAMVWIDKPKDKSLVPEKYVKRNDDLMKKYGVRGFPTYVLLSHDGSKVLGKLSAGQDKTAASFSAEVEELAQADRPDTNAKVTLGIKSATAEKVNKSLTDFSGLTADQKMATVDKVYKEVTDLLKSDPVFLSMLDSEAIIGLIPYCDYSKLSDFSSLLKNAISSGTPADSVYKALDASAPSAKGNLDLTYKFMTFYSVLGKNKQAMDMLPEMDELKKAEDMKTARPWVNLLKNVSNRDYLELCFAMQQKDIPMKEKLEMVNIIAGFCSAADEEFVKRWFAHVLKNEEMTAALKKVIDKNVSSAIKSKDFKSRTISLASNMKVVNMISDIKADQKISRVALRHWQMEYANALKNYRSFTQGSTARDPRTGRMTRQRVPKSIKFEDLVKNQPSDKTLAAVSTEENELFVFQQAVSKVKQGIYDKDALAKLISYKDKYPETVAKFCGQVFGDWAAKVNPNKALQRSNDYYYVNGTYYYRGGYGGQQRQGIPLTRSKQVRNLKECSAMFNQIFTSGVKVDPSEQVKAFAACFSKAEIITEDEIRMVFPTLDHMTDDMMVQLSSHVISLVYNNWRDMKDIKKVNTQYQQLYGTNRSEEQVKEEIVKAYEGIISIMRERLNTSTENIDLTVGVASYLFDLAEFKYQNEICTLEEYTELRDESFKRFKELAKLYERVLEKGRVEYTAAPFINWFSVILGASDLNTLDVAVVVSNTHLDEVKKTLFGMNEKWREKHIEMFGKWVSSKWSTLKPHVKLSFLQSAREVLGNHPSVESIEKQMNLYQDILSEIKLNVSVDGPTDIGHNSVFGAMVSLRHTPELEREANGFNKYIQNGVRSMGIRTPIDYRKNFAKNIRKALKDKFEVTGMTWMDNSARSQPSAVTGWRETPMVYLKLKALDPSVDKIPSIQIDMDFSDGYGQVVLPVLSNVILVNAQSAEPVKRPYQNAELELLLDSRGAKDGKISLEVKVTGEGMIPDLSKMLETDGSYKLTGLEETSPIILRLEQRGDNVVPIAELTADVKIDWDGKLEKFAFPKLKGGFDDIKVSYKKYKDADIIPAEKVTYITAVTKRSASFYILWSLIGVLAAGVVIALTRKTKGEEEEEVKGQFVLPSKVSVVSVLSFLNQIRQSGHPLAADTQLKIDIETLEKSYFTKDSSGSSDLNSILNNWHTKVS